MSTNLSVFNFENSNVRVVIGENGEPLFVAKDVAVALGYAEPTNAVRQHCDEEGAKYPPLQTAGGMQQVRVIDESDVYSLIFGSKLESSKRFKKWVTSEVLPSIRKTGSYSSQQKTLTANEILAQSAMALVEHDRRLAATEIEVKQVAAKVAQISMDLRNGVPHGFISRKNAKSIYK